jgi:hypothetical protein
VAGPRTGYQPELPKWQAAMLCETVSSICRTERWQRRNNHSSWLWPLAQEMTIRKFRVPTGVKATPTGYAARSGALISSTGGWADQVDAGWVRSTSEMDHETCTSRPGRRRCRRTYNARRFCVLVYDKVESRSANSCMQETILIRRVYTIWGNFAASTCELAASLASVRFDSSSL